MAEKPNLENSKGWVIKEIILGGDPPSIKGINKSGTQVNFFLGSDEKRWQKSIPAYNALSYGEIYPG